MTGSETFVKDGEQYVRPTWGPKQYLDGDGNWHFADSENAHNVSSHGDSDANSGLPSIDNVTAPWSNETVNKRIERILKYLDGTNQTVGFAVALAGLAADDILFLTRLGNGSFFLGLAIAGLKTDWQSPQSVIEFGIGASVSFGVYMVPWLLPAAAAYSAISIDKGYSKTLPERAVEGYKSSNNQYRNHPYFRHLDW